MKATYKQMEVLNAMIKEGRLKLDPEDVNRLTKEAASELIANNSYTNGNSVKRANGNGITGLQINGNWFNAARLGQAVNLTVNGKGIDFCLEHRQQFLAKVGVIYKLLSDAEEAVKNPAKAEAVMTIG